MNQSKKNNFIFIILITSSGESISDQQFKLYIICFFLFVKLIYYFIWDSIITPKS